MRYRAALMLGLIEVASCGGGGGGAPGARLKIVGLPADVSTVALKVVRAGGSCSHAAAGDVDRRVGR
jgi:hypothetical protein